MSKAKTNFQSYTWRPKPHNVPLSAAYPPKPPTWGNQDHDEIIRQERHASPSPVNKHDDPNLDPDIKRGILAAHFRSVFTGYERPSNSTQQTMDDHDQVVLTVRTQIQGAASQLIKGEQPSTLPGMTELLQDIQDRIARWAEEVNEMSLDNLESTVKIQQVYVK